MTSDPVGRRDHPDRGPVALLVAGIVTTVVGWAVFTVAIVVLTADPDAGSGAQIGLVVAIVLGALLGSVGPFLITGGAIWWSLRVRERHRERATFPGGFGGGIGTWS